MAFVFLILIFFIDQQGVSDKHCLLSLSSIMINDCEAMVHIGSHTGETLIFLFE